MIAWLKRWRQRRKHWATERDRAMFKLLTGLTPGGMYPGITYIPGDPSKPWEEGELHGQCMACEKGHLRYLWQGNEYLIKCNYCGYLDDIGRKMTEKELQIRNMVYEEIKEHPERFQ